MNESSPAPRDHVDGVVEQWAVERPDWDLTGMALFGRIARLERLAQLRRSEILRAAGLTEGDVDVLASLFRHPEGLRPRDLRHTTMVGSGTLTARLDRLQAGGLIERHRDTDDRRGKVLRLTTAGRSTVVTVVSRLLDIENEMLDAVPPDHTDQLAELLRILLVRIEHSEGETRGHRRRQGGLTP